MTVTVEVADAPAATDGGARFVASMVKSGAGRYLERDCLHHPITAGNNSGSLAAADRSPDLVFGIVAIRMGQGHSGESRARSGNAAGYRSPSHDEFRRCGGGASAAVGQVGGTEGAVSRSPTG